MAEHLGLKEDERKLLQIGGLVHDLGHGPFSHSFELWTRTRNIEFDHEQQSLRLFRRIVDEEGIDLDDDFLRQVEDVVMGRKSSYLFTVVNNKLNGIDVDKFDYLLRDSHNCGIRASYDYRRVIYSCKVINDEICYRSKDAYNIYELFHTRYRMFKTVYYHRVARALEYMLCDILDNADRMLGIRQTLDNDEYVGLNDSIIHHPAISHDPLIRRIERRELYSMVDELIVDRDINIKPIDLTSGVVDPADIIVDKFNINFALDRYNPLDYVRFYDKTSSTFTLDRSKVSLLIPERYYERYVRIYVKNNKDIQPVKQALERWKRM
jgi:HD superfamily phosphohydrolase